MSRKPLLLVMLAICLAMSGTISAQNNPNNQLVILRGQVDLVNDVVMLEGQNFLGANDPSPTVTLSGFPMTVEGVPTATQIYFAIPDGILPGSYLVTVSRGHQSAKTDTFAITIGINGEPGPQGPQGEVGPAGPEGPEGPAGPQGPAGPEGPAGATGAEGPQGPVGPAGEQGPQGETGATGAPGATGPIGPQGLQGPTGPIGPQGAQGEIGPIGPQGPQGPQGLTGPAGPQGLQGETGAVGPQGPQGLQGATGPAGPQGVAGPQGPVGPQGPTGATGATGPQGPQGLQGPQGPAGEGATGIDASVSMNFSVDDRSGWTRTEALSDDTCFFNIPLGFTFNGFGASVSTISVSSNGVLFFGQQCSSSFSNTALPSFISSNPMLFFFWDDLNDYGSGEGIEYATFGSAPGRVFNMYFRNRLLSSICGADAVHAMIQIHESSNIVNVSYPPTFTGCANIRGAGATLGIQGANGADAVMVGFNSPVLDDNTNGQHMSFRPRQ